MQNRILRVGACLGAFILLGAGCDAPTPAPPPAAPVDISTVSCSEIPAARDKVRAAYTAAVTEAADTYAKARGEFETDLNDCLRGIWKGGPCDNEWKASQQAAERAWGDISNDDAYRGWKKAKADWDACYAKWEEKYREWSENNTSRERTCQEEFQAKVDAANKAYRDAEQAAKAKRDADLAALDALEKECNKPKPTTTGGVMTGGGAVTGGGSVTGGGTTPGGVTTPPPTPPTLGRQACVPAGIPGSNSTPRTGRGSDFGPKDIAINLLQQVAEDVTGTAVPISAIDNQIFAGIVCVKIRSRIAEMNIEESDAQLSGNRPAEIRLRQRIAQYGRALSVWCAIAEGRPALEKLNVKQEAAAIGAMPSGACRTNADCGAPLCCSANTIATGVCTRSGACVNEVRNCGTREVCMGPDASQPLYDHCGPNHDGNWVYGKSKPNNWIYAQPGVPRSS